MSCALALAASHLLLAVVEPPKRERAVPGEVSPAAAAHPEPADAARLVKLPPGMKLDVWAKEPMLENPVGFGLDEKGRIYFSDPRYLGHEPIDQPIQAVYRVDTDGTIHRIITDAGKPNGVAVSPDHRRTRVATHLLVAQARHAIARGCVAWTLEVRVSSTGAQELYRRFGFAPAGIRRRYYENPEDAIVMWCHDLATPEYAARLEDLSCGR